MLFPALALLGCPLPDADSPDADSPDAGVVPDAAGSELVTGLDLLVVIDNSGSMASKQTKLAQQLPRLLQVLVSGDNYAGDPAPPPGLTPEQRYFRPITSLHLGVVSTNMGGIDSDEFRLADTAAVRSCAGFGDDGKLQQKFHQVHKTPYDEGIRRTLEWMHSAT